jgi:hypothetical protein
MNIHPNTVQIRKAAIDAIIIQQVLTNCLPGNKRRYKRRIETLVRNRAIEYIGTLTKNGCVSRLVVCRLRDGDALGVSKYQ